MTKVEHIQCIKAFQTYVKLRGTTEEINEKIKQIGTAALAEKDPDYFRFVDSFYTMVEECVNSLKKTTQSYAAGLLSSVFQVKSASSLTSPEAVDNDNTKPKKNQTRR